MSVDGPQENTPDQELVEPRTHFIASGSGLYMLGGRGGEKKVGEEIVEWGDSFGPIVIRHIGCRRFQVGLC